MAEYKNGVNFRGNMSVEADDISPEVKTGRVVFVDEDLYESNEEYKAKVDKCVEEGFMRSDEAGSGGSSGGGAEPLIVTVTKDGDGVWTLDKTYNEIKTAVESGRVCVVKGQVTVGNTYVFTTYVSYVYSEEGEYYVLVSDLNNQVINLPTSFCANSADDYPIVD